MHSLKSFTANRANRLLGRHGPFWQREYYDRLIRNEEELDRALRYVIHNPEKAGLENWPWAGVSVD
jgi:putative DNA methylase